MLIHNSLLFYFKLMQIDCRYFAATVHKSKDIEEIEFQQQD